MYMCIYCTIMYWLHPLFIYIYIYACMYTRVLVFVLHAIRIIQCIYAHVHSHAIRWSSHTPSLLLFWAPTSYQVTTCCQNSYEAVYEWSLCVIHFEARNESFPFGSRKGVSDCIVSYLPIRSNFSSFQWRSPKVKCVQSVSTTR